jgi:prophage DNA circulation protein
MESIQLAGGQSVDTAEYPYFGLWSNNPLNEKPQTIRINGFIRGETYIKNRNALVESLRVVTDDDNPGYLDLPLWGRFPIVVSDFNVGEKGQENGQCTVSLELTRAGVTTEERWKFEGTFEGKTAIAAKTLEDEAANQLEKELTGNTDTAALSNGFGKLKDELLKVIGRVQGAESQLNTMTNMVVGISSLISQGVQSPKELAQALFGAAASILSGIIEIKNSGDDTIAYFRTRNNVKNILRMFLSGGNYSMDIEPVTVKQQATKESLENLHRTLSFCMAGEIMVHLEDTTYQQAKGYWALYEQLEASLYKDDPAMYRAIQDMRVATAQELTARNLTIELSKNILNPAPLLYIAHYLGCEDTKIRQLNPGIVDSFVLKGETIYV